MKTVCKFVIWLQIFFVITMRSLIGLAPNSTILIFYNLKMIFEHMYVVLSKPMYVEIWAASSEKVGFGGLPTKFDIKVI